MYKKKVSREWAAAHLPRRKKNDNKTAGGKCLIIGGSPSMMGAGVLAAQAAGRIGAGYVYLATAADEFDIYRNPDFLVLNYKNPINFSAYSSVAIGPGLGKSALAKKILKSLVKSEHKKVVIDADALNLAAENNLFPLPADWVATPHAGELARILKRELCSSDDRTDLLRLGQRRLGCQLLFKGHPTLFSNGRAEYIITTGNKALAKAGSGDVLTGIIAGLLSQGLAPSEAVRLGAFLHGKIADEWVKSRDYLSLMPSDLIEAIPATLMRLRKPRLKLKKRP